MKYSRDTLQHLLSAAPIKLTCHSHEEAVRLRWRLYKIKGDHELELKIEGRVLQILPRQELQLTSKEPEDEN